MTVHSVNHDQVRAVLGSEGLQRLIARLRKRMSLGEPLSGKIQLSDTTPEERAAVAKLLGRQPSRGTTLTIDLDRLRRILVDAEVCDDLEDAVVALVGVVPNKRAANEASEQQWQQLWEKARDRCGDNPPVLGWLADIQAKGLLKRLSGGDVKAADALLSHALAIVSKVHCRQCDWPNLLPAKPATAIL